MIPAAGSAKASPLWLVLTYFLHVVGEMCLSPVGLSAMTRLAPTRVAGPDDGRLVPGHSVGSYLGGRVASLYEAYSLPSSSAWSPPVRWWPRSSSPSWSGPSTG